VTEPGSSESSPPPSGRDYLRLVLLGALIGLPAALVAALFLALVHELQHWLWTDLPDALGGTSPQWYLIIGLPLAGAVIVALARTLLPGDGGHEPLKGLNTKPTPVGHGPGVALAALGTLGSGAVLGPEAPVIALGSVVALAVTAFARLGVRENAVLSNAGSFSAISALFGGPIVGGVLMVEAGAARLGAALIPALLPGFVAAAVGYTVFVGFGDWGGLDTPGLKVPNLAPYDGTHVTDLLLMIVAGVAAALVIAAINRLAKGLAEGGGRRFGVVPFLLAGGLAVGIIALVADALGADSQDVLFSGQESIPALISESSTGIVLLLIGAKALAYAVSLASGFRGGPIFPAIFLGVGLATLPVVWFDVSPTVAVAAGSAAGMAAQSRLILTPMLLGMLLVGTQGLAATPAVVLAAVAGWITVTGLEQRRGPAAQPAPAT
jgi:chloride channel protein, CIC family